MEEEQLKLLEALTDEQKALYNYLEKDFSIYLFEQDDEICAEVESWTDGGVDMVITLMPFTYEKLYEWWQNFDIDETIDLHRQDETYRNCFSCRRSVEDFDNWYDWLEYIIIDYPNK